MIHSSQTMPKSCSVAVIGAGVSGLCAARELLREGHRVVVFEKTNRIGGTWVYNPHADSDASGLDPDRRVAQGNLYSSLRTNVPRLLMGFSDYPFPDPEDSFGDPRAFPGHAEILAFIEAFAREEGLLDVVRLGVEVVRVERIGERKDQWAVKWRRTAEDTGSELFEAVVVCNGHNALLRFADIPGIKTWRGQQIHSHNYRIPEPFLDQVVVIVGKGASAFDISKEISKFAKEVHVASRTSEVKLGKLDNYDNMWQHLMIKCAHEDGTVVFEDGSEVIADVILHCTGYIFDFPFFEENTIVSIEDSRVSPLFKHVFPPHLAPWISFVGISSKTITYLMIEFQCKWVAKVLSGKLTLPSEEEMVASVNEVYAKMEEMKKPKRYTHFLSAHEPGYLNWLAAEVGLPLVEEWKLQLYSSSMKGVVSYDDSYRDRWNLDQWISQTQHANQREVTGNLEPLPKVL
ncbi:hypothetical protein KFK09_008081 [Dendrobium nobile]|uniref:Flavin-containing monooxygenase n=1 Tax=Dendrobium nobile TaxID=94219 RepID=A0A8T3BTL3_DENNO|nr:hypothetical protein KFK09_008081 [Dendrobium nobile]